MKNLTNFHKTVETCVDPCLPLTNKTRENLQTLICCFALQGEYSPTILKIISCPIK